jgi:hypothetical protein
VTLTLTGCLRQTWALRPLLAAAGVALGTVLGAGSARAQPTPSIRLNPPGDRRAGFEVTGLQPTALLALDRIPLSPDQWRALFAVSTVPSGSPETNSLPPLLGAYRIDGSVLRFQPRFPLEPRVVYRARFDPGKLFTASEDVQQLPAVSATFALPADPAAATTRVVAVYPSGDELPENLLKFYLHFSAPMSRGMAYEHIHLRDGMGKAVKYPFVELAEELWDPSGQRLTILFDPGRIKTGLKPREELGPILHPGATYTLTIDHGWRDAAGQPLVADYRKTFRAGPTDSQSPDPATWKISVPGPGTRDPLVLTLPEPLDHAMLTRVLAIVDDDHRPVPGDIAVEAGETRWRFTPESPWRAGRYKITVDKDLEDRAGNSIGRPFEVDVFDKVERKPVAETVSLPFEVGPAPR